MTSEFERHLPYLPAFDIKVSEALSDSAYCKYIFQFIMDDNISANNAEDIEFFKKLMYDGCYGSIVKSYLNWTSKKFNFIKIDSQYYIKMADFYSQLKDFYFISHLLKIYRLKSRENEMELLKIMFPTFLKKFPSTCIEFIKTYPIIAKEIPATAKYLAFI